MESTAQKYVAVRVSSNFSVYLSLVLKSLSSVLPVQSCLFLHICFGSLARLTPDTVSIHIQSCLQISRTTTKSQLRMPRNKCVSANIPRFPLYQLLVVRLSQLHCSVILRRYINTKADFHWTRLLLRPIAWEVKIPKRKQEMLYEYHLFNHHNFCHEPGQQYQTYLIPQALGVQFAHPRVSAVSCRQLLLSDSTRTGNLPVLWHFALVEGTSKKRPNQRIVIQ